MYRRKKNVMKFRTGTLDTRKMAHLYGRVTNSSCLLCHQPDSQIHMLSSYQNALIQNMVTERHDIASRLIIKTLNKGDFGGNIIFIDIKVRHRWLNKVWSCRQMWCVDWLRTVTVYTKQTTGCPRWDWGASDTLIHPYTFSLSLQPAIRQDQRCMQLLSVALTLSGGLDWTGLGAATPVTPPGLKGSTPWRTCYKVARSKQGITASSSLTCIYLDSHSPIACWSSACTSQEACRAAVSFSHSYLQWRPFLVIPCISLLA